MEALDFTTEIRLLAAKVKSAKIRQLDIAQAVSTDQSQVSRILRGKVRRRTPLLEKICNYVNNASRTVDAEMVCDNEVLVSALADIWDGSSEHAIAIATVIRSLGLLKEAKPEVPKATRSKQK